ncbi:MAG: hypothetical protein DMD58_06860 [Gemmatimonadetes bacterium]|nr:MAG: hypothetical protein DMD58_06860 [Gemmatimonadota bacterium]
MLTAPGADGRILFEWGSYMKWIAVSIVLISIGCMRRPSVTVADLPIALPCTGLSNGTALWADSLPLVSDTALQHVVAGGSALHYPDDVRLANRTGIVRARFVIDTLGGVVPGSSIIEASTDEGFARAVCQALPMLKFAPVIVDGHKAAAGLVHVPFTFRVER